MRGFELVHPATLGEAIALLDTDDDSTRAFAGGTALMLMLKSGLYRPARFIHLGGLEATHGRIEATPDGGLRIGALATLSALEHNADVAKLAPVITRAMTHLSNVRVRNAARVAAFSASVSCSIGRRTGPPVWPSNSCQYFACACGLPPGRFSGRMGGNEKQIGSEHSSPFEHRF